MHPHAPSRVPEALVDQNQVVRKRRRHGGVGLLRKVGFAAVFVTVSCVAAFVVWLKNEVPHFNAAAAVRESPLVQAQSLKSLLTAFGPKKSSGGQAAAVATPAENPPLLMQTEAAATRHEPPVWLMTDIPEFAEAQNDGHSSKQTLEQLRQSLREAGARQMGKTVRFAVLNLAELLAMDAKAWKAGLATPAAGENRASAMLLTFYLRYLDREGDSAGVNELLRAIEKGMPEARAVQEFILSGRSIGDLESEMGRVFADAGVELQFTQRGGALLRP